ncbi:MAG: hypothetical protein WBV60_07835 [Terriglobales bacterium]
MRFAGGDFAGRWYMLLDDIASVVDGQSSVSAPAEADFNAMPAKLNDPCCPGLIDSN